MLVVVTTFLVQLALRSYLFMPIDIPLPMPLRSRITATRTGRMLATGYRELGLSLYSPCTNCPLLLIL